MSGKAILFLVVGFSLIFLVLGQNFGRISTEGIDNSSNYFERTVAHNIASSGANIGANQIFLNPNWTAGLNNISFDGGVLNVSVDIIDAFQNIRRVNSIGIFKDDTSIVQITLQPSSFAQFAYFSENENGINWITGDTVGGRFHTQDFITSDGHPVFIGKATSYRGIKYATGSKTADSPIFDGTFGRDSIPIPSTSISNLENEANINGHTFTGNDTVSLTFIGDSITYTTSTNTTTKVPTRWGWKYETTTTRNTQTVLASSFAPNGVIFADNSVLRIKGQVSGQYTVGASGTGYVDNYGGGHGTGIVYVDDNITYTTDPRTNPNSTDLLGIVAEKSVLVADNYANLHDGVNIDAAIFCKDGGFGAENFTSIAPANGPINLYGGICQQTRQAVGLFSQNRWTHQITIQSGYYKHYYYDPRLATASPPSYPATGKFQIVSWYESNSKL